MIGRNTHKRTNLDKEGSLKEILVASQRVREAQTSGGGR